MPTVRLIHWKEEETKEKAHILQEAGFEVSLGLPSGPKFFQDLEAEEPGAVVIDLSRLPSQGRDLAVGLRTRKGTRHIPILFVGGDPAKVEQIKKLLPDAAFCRWDEAPAVIWREIAAGTREVVVPDSVFAAYAGRPLATKLGIKAGGRMAHIGAPDGFAAALGDLPPGAALVAGPDERADLTVWFVGSVEALAEDLEGIVAASRSGPVWIAWPKKGSAHAGDLTQQAVREAGMGVGMVDYKICSIDADWSALLFKWRGKDE